MNNKFNSVWVEKSLKTLSFSKTTYCELIGKSRSTMSRWISNESFPEWVIQDLKNRLRDEVTTSLNGVDLEPNELIHYENKGGVSLSDCIDGCIISFAKMSKGEIETVDTGFATLDNGWHNWAAGGKLIVVAAKTGEGKTALAQQLAETMSVDDAATLYFSLEMTPEEMTFRTLSRYAGISVTRLEAGKVTEVEKDQLKDAILRARDINVEIVTWACWIEEIVKYARKSALAARMNKKPLKAIFVDYAQLIMAHGESRNVQVGLVSRSLKLLSMELGIPVFLLAQYNREYLKNEGQLPEYHDLKDSSQLAFDADLIIDVNVPKHDKRKGFDYVNIRCLKSRRGRLQDLKLGANQETMQFFDA